MKKSVVCSSCGWEMSYEEYGDTVPIKPLCPPCQRLERRKCNDYTQQVAVRRLKRESRRVQL